MILWTLNGNIASLFILYLFTFLYLCGLGDNIQWATDTTIAGRAPVTLIGSKLFAFIDRDGKEIILHSAEKSTGFKQITKIVVS